MYGIDLFTLAATAAALFWGLVGMYAQQQWRIFYVFTGKKQALKVYIALLTLTTLQLLVITGIDLISTWRFTTFWPAGLVFLAGSIWLFVNALRETGLGALFNTGLFDRHHRKAGPLWKKYRQPLYISYVSFYFGLGLLTGHIAYMSSALLLTVGLLLIMYLVPSTHS